MERYPILFSKLILIIDNPFRFLEAILAFFEPKNPETSTFQLSTRRERLRHHSIPQMRQLL